jgi:hypothetical protein
MMQLVCLERLLDRGIRPDLVFVEIMPPMLSWRGGEPVEERMLDGSRLSAAEMGRLLPYYEQPRRVLGKWSAASLAPAHRRAQELRRLFALDARDGGIELDAADHLMDKHGWQHVPCTADAARRRELTLLAANQYDGALADFEIAPRPAAALRQLLERCRSEAIGVALVLMPEAESFRALYSAESEAKLNGFVATLRREYDSELIDARRWVADEQFSDGHHLTPAGAVAFTDRFEREALPASLAKGGRRLAGRPNSKAVYSTRF